MVRYNAVLIHPSITEYGVGKCQNLTCAAAPHVNRLAEHEGSNSNYLIITLDQPTRSQFQLLLQKDPQRLSQSSSGNPESKPLSTSKPLKNLPIKTLNYAESRIPVQSNSQILKHQKAHPINTGGTVTTKSNSLE
jgi:hypothetical protein